MTRLAGLVCAVAVVVTGLAGCGGSQVFQCNPDCPRGYHCEESGCVADNGTVDAAAPVPDLAGAACQPACGGATPHCNPAGLCVPCLEDSHCPVGQICKSLGQRTACVPGCADDARCGGGTSKCCNGSCTDTAKDNANCGTCGTACSAMNAKASCAGGRCTVGGCTTGWADCNGDAGDGCETNVRADARNCGACGMACNLAHAIADCGLDAGGKSGCLIRACDFGWDDCDGNAQNGCETNVIADAKNCGACGKPCAAVPHAKNSCINASCQLVSCDAGFGDCDANLVNGCEIALSTDALNCGVCGNRCGQGLVCSGGMCTCPPCNLPNAKSACVNLKCAIGACNVNWGDCDGLPQNGCERALSSDAMNCGACGNACAQGLVCVNGSCTCPNCQRPNARTSCVNNMCQLDACFAGFGNCNGNDADGCEIDFSGDNANCGACGNKCPVNNSCVAGKCEAYNCGGWTPLMIGGVVLCYTNQPGTCQQAHQFCEALGNGYRLMCGDHWNQGRSNEGCGGNGAFTSYDIVNAMFKGSQAIGGWNANVFDCVSGGQNGNCNGDVGNQPGANMNGSYAFCSPKNYFKNPPDGPAFANVCGN